jgi:ubiquinone/menaquinone biosynthesis C-methylase UbiE
MLRMRCLPQSRQGKKQILIALGRSDNLRWQRVARMSFVPSYAQWVRDRMELMPSETANWCGDVSGQHILDLGCGDMLEAFGLLSLNPRHITCVDVVPRTWDVMQHAATQIVKHGFTLPADYESRLTYLIYEGTQLPFADNTFDLIFSWSVFEHIAEVPATLAEARRVVKPEGRIFIQVFPWFHTFAGSHLTDYIDEPFFHLHRSPEWVYARLQEFAAAHEADDVSFQGFHGPNEYTVRKWVLEHMWPEYGKLNRYSARMFLMAALEGGLIIERLSLSTEKVEEPPSDVPFADVVTHCMMVLLRPGKPAQESQGAAPVAVQPGLHAKLARALDENNALRQEIAALQSQLDEEWRVRDDILQSVSWRLTKPGRDVMQVVRKLRGFKPSR